MGLLKEEIEINIDWKDFKKVFKLFCNSNNSIGKINGRELTEIEKSTALQVKREVPRANIEIPKIVGDFDIDGEDVEFKIHEGKIIFLYNLSLKSAELIGFVNLIKEYKNDPGLLLYGVKKELAHHVVRELINEDFFWSCTDELAPFGSDEGDLALEDFRRWREENTNERMMLFLTTYLTGGWAFSLSDYLTKRVLDKELIKGHELDKEFDTHYNYFTLDTCIIATCFGQLIDEGKIDEEVIPILETSIQKLILWSEIQKEDWDFAQEYIEKLNVLKRAINEIKKKAADNNV